MAILARIGLSFAALLRKKDVLRPRVPPPGGPLEFVPGGGCVRLLPLPDEFPRWNPGGLHGAPFLWPFLFDEGVIEFFQWGLLGFAVLMAGITSGYFRARQLHDLHWFSLGFSTLCLVAVLEEAGDIRHTLRYEAARHFGWESAWVLGAEASVFALIGALGALWLYRFEGVLRVHLRTLWDILLAAAVFGLTTMSSLVPGLFGYVALGSHFIEATGGRIHEVGSNAHDTDTLSYYIVDGPFEESLELIGAAALATFAVKIWRHRETLARTHSG